MKKFEFVDKMFNKNFSNNKKDEKVMNKFIDDNSFQKNNDQSEYIDSEFDKYNDKYKRVKEENNFDKQNTEFIKDDIKSKNEITTSK